MDFKKYLACEFVPLYHLKTLNIHLWHRYFSSHYFTIIIINSSFLNCRQKRRGKS